MCTPSRRERRFEEVAVVTPKMSVSPRRECRFLNVHAVEARAPFWPFENWQKTDEVFKVLLQNERFAWTKRAFGKENFRKSDMPKNHAESTCHVGDDQQI